MSTKWSREHQKELEETAERLFKINPQLSLKKLAGEIRKENGTRSSYSTLSPIYRKLREDSTCQQQMR